MFPLAKYSQNVFVKILSISVAELFYTLSVFQLSEKGHSSVGNQEIVEHNYKFEHEEYLC